MEDRFPYLKHVPAITCCSRGACLTRQSINDGSAYKLSANLFCRPGWKEWSWEGYWLPPKSHKMRYTLILLIRVIGTWQLACQSISLVLYFVSFSKRIFKIFLERREGLRAMVFKSGGWSSKVVTLKRVITN